MSRLGRRVNALEVKHGGPQKTFFTWLPPGLTKSEQDAFIAAEETRLGVGDNKLVVVSWLPTQDN
jgi:hypothetical protein